MVVLLVGAVAWSAMRTYGERETEVSEQAAEVAATAGAYLDEYFVGLDALASAIVRNPAVVALDQKQTSPLFADLLRTQPLLINIVLTGPDAAVHGSGLQTSGSPIDMNRNAFRRNAIQTGLPQVSDLLTGQVSGEPTVVLAYPVRGSDRQIVGVVGLGVNLIRLQTVFARIPLPDGSILALLDRTGHVLARNVDAERYIGSSAGTPVAGPRGVSVQVGPDGVNRVTSNVPIARGPWVLSVGIPMSVVRGGVAPLWRRNILIAGSVLVVLLGVAIFLAWQTTLQLGRLHALAQRIANGDLSPPPQAAMPNLELEQVQAAFTTMAGNLRDARDAISVQVEQQKKLNESLQSLQRQVVRQERLAAVGVLVSGVAHELNNPLQGILGAAELLEQREGLAPDVLEDLEFLKTQSERARDIIRNLSRFGSQQSGPPSYVDLRDVIGEVVQLRQRELQGTGIALDVRTTSRRRVYANFTELEQVALNFVINAQQAIADSGVERGKILMKLVDRDDRVRLEVHDNGPGVRPDDEPKLFQPFFTTKPVGKGTGLGLSVSYGIVDSYGGVIGHFNNESGGATFFFELKAETDVRDAEAPATSSKT
jgi:C4-dicarboxylate-specific signal transduction histidine kinase